MSATTPGAIPAHQQRNGHRELADWREHTRVFLQPIAAPSILGKRGAREASLPGGIVHQPIEFEHGEPGVRHGQ